MDDARAEPQQPLPDLFTAEEWKKLGERLGLTPRQLQIARLICQGRSRRQISSRLRISPSTVRMHTDALFKRLSIHDRIGVPIRLVLAHEGLGIEQQSEG